MGLLPAPHFADNNRQTLGVIDRPWASFTSLPATHPVLPGDIPLQTRV